MFGSSLPGRSFSTAYAAFSQTDSTAAESMFSSSLVGLNCSGKGSIVDFGAACFKNYRTSIVKNAKRRLTVPVREQSRESQASSLNDRGSNLDEEGKINSIETSFKQLKCFSAVEDVVDTFKDSEEARCSLGEDKELRLTGSGSPRREF